MAFCRAGETLLEQTNCWFVSSDRATFLKLNKWQRWVLWMLFCQDFQGMPYSTSSHPSDCVRQVVRQNIHHRKVEYINMLPFADNTHFSVLSVHINLQEYGSNNERTHHESCLACRCCNRAHTGIVSEDSSMIMQLKDRFDDAPATHIDITHKSVLGGVTNPSALPPCHRAAEGGNPLIARRYRTPTPVFHRHQSSRPIGHRIAR